MKERKNFFSFSSKERFALKFWDRKSERILHTTFCTEAFFTSLVSKGANIHVSDDLPLLHFVSRGKFTLVKFLLLQGANPNARWSLVPTSRSLSSSPSPCLIPSCFLFFLSLFPFLFSSREGAPLSEAVCKGYEQIVWLLIENGADVHLGVPLQVAVNKVNLPMVQLLLEKGASPDKGAPLKHAISVKSPDICHCLIKAGAPTGRFLKDLLNLAIDQGVFPSSFSSYPACCPFNQSHLFSLGSTTLLEELKGPSGNFKGHLEEMIRLSISKGNISAAHYLLSFSNHLTEVYFLFLYNKALWSIFSLHLGIISSHYPSSKT